MHRIKFLEKASVNTYNGQKDLDLQYMKSLDIFVSISWILIKHFMPSNSVCKCKSVEKYLLETPVFIYGLTEIDYTDNSDIIKKRNQVLTEIKI